MKTIKTIFLISILTTLLSGCTNNSDYHKIDELKISFVPSKSAEEIISATEPLEELIKTQMETFGYVIDKVTIDVGASYEAVGEALASGTTDIGFIPAGTYALYEEDGVDVILSATRQGLSIDSESAKDWNDNKPTTLTDEQVKYYRSIVLAGPSEKGTELSEKVNNKEELTFEDIQDANICFQSPSSSSGYLYPLQKLQDTFGKTYDDLENPITSNGYDDAFAKLASEQCDLAPVYADARTEEDYVEDWTTTFGREKDIWEETNVIAVTDPIMNDTISISEKSEFYTEEFINAFDQSMISIAQTDEGKEIISIYSHEGYEVAVPTDYEKEREVQEQIIGE